MSQEKSNPINAVLPVAAAKQEEADKKFEAWTKRMLEELAIMSEKLDKMLEQLEVK